MSNVMSLDTRGRCEALVSSPASRRLHYDLQCSRLSTQRVSELANVVLCGQHRGKAERDGELELTDGRTLMLVVESIDEETETETLVFTVVSNVSHLHRVEKGPPTREQLAMQLVINQFGSAISQLAEDFAKNDALMELVAQDMLAAQRAVAESLSRSLGLNVVTFPRRTEGDTTPET